MTPEEEKRINDRFDRMAETLDRMLVTTTLLDRSQAEHIARFEKIDRTLDFIASSQASLYESMRHLVDALDSHRRNPHGHDQ